MANLVKITKFVSVVQKRKKTSGSLGPNGPNAQKVVGEVKNLEPVDAYQRIPKEKITTYINAMDRITQIILKVKKIVILRTVLVCIVSNCCTLIRYMLIN